MSKPKAGLAPASAPALPGVSTPRLLKVGKAPRITGHSATKNGKGGTEGTWAAIMAHLNANGGQISEQDLRKICTDNGDSGFAGYAQGKQRRWLVPVEAQ